MKTTYQSRLEGRMRRQIASETGVDAEALAELERERPRTRADCVNGPRPCPFVSCRYNLFLDVNPDNGAIRFAFPGKALDELEHTCALDVADAGGVTLDAIGQLLNVTRERIRQIESNAIEALEGADL